LVKEGEERKILRVNFSRNDRKTPRRGLGGCLKEVQKKNWKTDRSLKHRNKNWTAVHRVGQLKKPGGGEKKEECEEGLFQNVGINCQNTTTEGVALIEKSSPGKTGHRQMLHHVRSRKG